ncbi:hypothetical protein [Pseudoalteromonas sp. S16_S37]|uniref:hypothetical protein n=1 Tax=Pseudoalteromonas sp. S16_S37 TaxID=2720228 RepID=UPI001681A4CD|nr:hypothetical protein [Pseudoalteromonas sp. S16_S37]MBD1583712.1 hypothetical protein [Pseudoalteromonas sp. S16_S37]
MTKQIATILASVLGMLSLANGVFMLIAPETWYWLVPGVADRGPFNQHLVRDLGFIYALIGTAFIYGAFYVRYRLQLWLIPAAWLVSHGIFHIWEIWVGICGPEFFVIDFAGVTLPAFLSVCLVCMSYKGMADE